ncbi:unnamed protein product [Bursaphelenchus xylophilus]|uniref:(pine wood nematode) hypothetical protein n=1 Tax=Bursaphelenchus xylophilus TaxID=6326 RepID=A0A7I8X149_BURXY|nr:unnamed protein product [Bursaphelenchus xylophilus]CAG9130208.1 unnamed protein product [Bursaphelenchus xylophilus]
MPRRPRTDFRSNFRGISVHSIRIEGNRGPNSWLDNYLNNKYFLGLIKRVCRLLEPFERAVETDCSEGRISMFGRSLCKPCSLLLFFCNNDKDQDVLVLSIRYGPSGMCQIGDVSWSNLKRMECGKIDASTSRLEKSLKAEWVYIVGLQDREEWLSPSNAAATSVLAVQPRTAGPRNSPADPGPPRQLSKNYFIPI